MPIAPSLPRLLLVALVLMLFVPAASSQTVQRTCDDFVEWSESRDSLGGSYLANGWDSGFIDVLRVTAINGTIQGHLIGVRWLDDGSYERTSLSLSGIYDQEQISFTLNGFLETLNVIGTWNPEGISISWPGENSSIAASTFQPIREDAMNQVLSLWPKHAARNANSELQLAMMERVAKSSPLDVTPVQRVYADRAAGYLGIPSRDAIDLLLMGWLASAQFSEHDPSALPNQSNWYDVHTFSNRLQAAQVADCYWAMNEIDGSIESNLSVAQGASMKVSTFSTGDYEAGTIVTTMIAFHGSNLITARIYGDEAMTEHGIWLVRLMIEDIGEIR